MTTLVVIVSFNSGNSLQRCVDAVLAQTDVQKTIVVVDNASSDADTLALLTDFERERNVFVKRLTQNVGYGAAINIAAQEWPMSDYIACLNADAFPAAGWLMALVSAANDDPQIASVASLMLQERNPHRLDGAGDALSLTGYPRRLGYGEPVATASTYGAQVFSACAGACLYRRSAFERVHGFDDRFFMYIEDVDLGFRLRLAGFENRLCHLAQVYHVGSESTGYRSDSYTFYGHRNTELMLWKCLPAPLFFVVGPMHCLAVLALLPIMIRRRQLRVYCRAKWSALKHLPTMLRARSQVTVVSKPMAILKAMTLHLRRA